MLPSVLTTTLSNSEPNVALSSFKMAVNSSPPRFIRPSLGLGIRTRPLVQNLYTANKIAAGKAPTTRKLVRLSNKLDMPRDFRDLPYQTTQGYQSFREYLRDQVSRIRVNPSQFARGSRDSGRRCCERAACLCVGSRRHPARVFGR